MELLMDKNKLNLQKCKIREVGENIIQTTRELIVPKVSIISKKKDKFRLKEINFSTRTQKDKIL